MSWSQGSSARFNSPQLRQNKLLLLNSTLASLQLPLVHQLNRLTRAGYVCENDSVAVIAAFKFSNAGLGNREPRQGHHRQLQCPLCSVPTTNDEFHLVIHCPSVSTLRTSSNISSFITACQLKNFLFPKIFDYFVNGNGKHISTDSYLERGNCLADMRKLWLSKW